MYHKSDVYMDLVAQRPQPNLMASRNMIWVSRGRFGNSAKLHSRGLTDKRFCGRKHKSICSASIGVGGSLVHEYEFAPLVMEERPLC